MSEKRYPGIKKVFAKIFRRGGSPKCVYAGPEYFGRVYAGPEPKNRPDETDIIDVYGGPEYFGEKTAEEPEEREVPEEDIQPGCVYAGPEYFGEKIPEETAPETGVDSEIRESPAERTPFRPEKIPEMRLVYGGPEYFARRRSPENGIQAPVYAGPEYFEGSEPVKQAEGGEKAPSPLTAGAYAGPEPEPRFFAVYAAPPFNGEMRAAPAKAPEDKSGKKKYCHECGNPLSGNEKFCPECGTKVNDER
ncbi:MAG: zinc ribbon domain-containing protein [Clostridia bacterium]|nr:zinc ribbon domain-containing protein [Clostridia bacterium]